MFYQIYQIGIEIKSERFILRSVDSVREEEIPELCMDSIKNISKLCGMCDNE